MKPETALKKSYREAPVGGGCFAFKDFLVFGFICNLGFTVASPCIFSVFNHNKLPGVENRKKMQEAPVKIGWLNPKGSVIC